MPVIKDGKIIQDDWQFCPADQPVGEGAVIVPAARLLAEAPALTQRNAPLGVLLQAGTKTPSAKGATDETGDDPYALQECLSALSLVAIEFPIFRNGRGFSSARILREELGFAGEIRAVGEVLRDQWQFMHRCGINSFQLADNITEAELAHALQELSTAYQPDAQTPTSIMHKRHGG